MLSCYAFNLAVKLIGASDCILFPPLRSEHANELAHQLRADKEMGDSAHPTLSGRDWGRVVMGRGIAVFYPNLKMCN